MVRLTRAQVREIDRRAIEKYHVPGIVLMENAARNAADVAWEMGGRTPQSRYFVLCGSGNNGGDGFGAVRHLHNRGGEVHIFTMSDVSRLKGDAKVNYDIASAMRIPFINEQKELFASIPVDGGPGPRTV